MSSRTLSESKKRYLYLVKQAGVPKKYRFDKGWKKLGPDMIRVEDPSKNLEDKHWIGVSEKSQIKWLDDLIKHRLYRHKGCIVVFGDYMSDSAERVAYGILCLAIRHGMMGRSFHADDLSRGPIKGIDGEIIPYRVVMLNKIHSDDDGPRRTIVRDFVNRHYANSFKILVIHGDNSIDFFYKKIGLNPQAIFYFPHNGIKFRANLVKAFQEH